VAADATDIGTVASNIANVNTVAGISSNVTTVAGISADVTAVAGDATDIGTVAGIAANVTTVAGIAANVTTVAGISSDVTTVATNVADITNFSDVYLGPAATDPATRNDSSALQAGDLYFNTVDDAIKVYTGSAWVAAYITAAGFVTVADAQTITGVKTFDNGLNTDTISEETSAAGVTVDGVLLKDSQVTTDQINEKTSAAGVTIDSVLLKDGLVGIGADGSASAPSIYRASDTNTGIFFPAADTIAFAEGGAEAMRITSDGKVLVNATADNNKWDNTTIGGNLFQVERSVSSGDSAISIANNPGTAANSFSALYLGRSRGTSNNSYTVVAADDGLGKLSFQGADGTDFVEAASVRGYVDGTPGANDMPGRLSFWTTADGSATPTERARITSAGLFQFNSGFGSVATAYGCRAWVNFEGNATPVAIRASANVSSITDNGTGLYTVNFTTAMPDANYSAVASGRINSVAVAASANITTTSVQLNCSNENAVTVDPSHVFVAVFR
jgi:hypothetical protein